MSILCMYFFAFVVFFSMLHSKQKKDEKIHLKVKYASKTNHYVAFLEIERTAKSKKEYWLRTFETARGLSDVEFALHIFHNDELKAETLLKNKKEFLETRDAILNCYKNMYLSYC